MHALRTSSTLARLVLVWFVLTLGAALLSPAVHAASMQLVCADGAGMKLVAVDGDGNAMAAGHHTLECPMCLAVTPPPQPLDIRFERPRPLSHALLPHVAAHLAATTGAPLPPRGPPARS